MHKNRILTEIHGTLSHSENQRIQNTTKKLKKHPTATTKYVKLLNTSID